MDSDAKVLQTGHKKRYDGRPDCVLICMHWCLLLQMLYLSIMFFQTLFVALCGHEGSWNSNLSMHIVGFSSCCQKLSGPEIWNTSWIMYNLPCWSHCLMARNVWGGNKMRRQREKQMYYMYRLKSFTASVLCLFMYTYTAGKKAIAPQSIKYTTTVL